MNNEIYDLPPGKPTTLVVGGSQLELFSCHFLLSFLDRFPRKRQGIE